MASVRAEAKASGTQRTAAAHEAARLAGGTFVVEHHDATDRVMSQISAMVGPDVVSPDEPNKLHPELDTDDLEQCYYTARRAGWTAAAVYGAIIELNRAYHASRAIDTQLSGLRGGNDLAEEYRDAMRDLSNVISRMYNLHQDVSLHQREAELAAMAKVE